MTLSEHLDVDQEIKNVAIVVPGRIDLRRRAPGLQGTISASRVAAADARVDKNKLYV